MSDSEGGRVTTSEPPAIELKSVSKTYVLDSGEEVTAVRDVSLQVKQGEFVCVIGPSGHGKSTILNMMAGFEKPTSGQVLANGKEVQGPSPERGVVFQRDTLFLWKRISENIEFGLKARGVPKEKRKQVVRDYLRTIGLERFADAWPKQLSGGMRRRVAIAAVLANEPDVVLMDEPFVGLDYVRQAQLHEVLLKLWAEAGHRAIYMITHDIDEALTLADRILVIQNGTLAHSIEVPLERPRTTEMITGEVASRVRRELLTAFGEAEVG
jgi:NitT/TauT family transport system ATP-binding protein